MSLAFTVRCALVSARTEGDQLTVRNIFRTRVVRRDEITLIAPGRRLGSSQLIVHRADGGRVPITALPSQGTKPPPALAELRVWAERGA